jgi:hypothetical protein
MNRAALFLGAVLLAGCASESHRVESRQGVRHYGLDDQPQKAVTAEGGLMRGSNETKEMPTGQFTGRERTPDQIGQYPATPAEADPRQLSDRKGPVGAPITRPE